MTVAEEEMTGEETILFLLGEHGAMTDETLCLVYRNYYVLPPRSEQRLRSLRSDLVKKGLVVHNGNYELNDTNRPARVWNVV